MSNIVGVSVMLIAYSWGKRDGLEVKAIGLFMVEPSSNLTI